MAWRKRRREDEDDFWHWDPFEGFLDIENEIRRMEEWMSRILRDLREKGEVHGPYVYGFTMRIGPDGKPIIQEFGNVRRGFGTEEGEYREPLTDVMEGENTISITAEIPGVTKEDIDLEVTEDTVKIKVDTPERKYYKEIALPEKVIPDSAKASYKNGILDVVLEKARKKKKGKKVKVE